ncbi:MAG: hypothetical protein DMF86_06475 [Acidobacteria bacterium]|nr:MAG: hypothetical protein DMF86_06475 [Acidobacteriota bacterium]
MTPRWVTVCDAAAVAFAALGALVGLFGRFTITPGLRVAMPSPLRIFFIAAAIVAIRHAAHPKYPLHRRLAGWLRSAVATDRSRAAAAALASRVVVLIAGYFAVMTIGVAEPVGFQLSADPLTNLPARFDAGWYGGIAIDGYYFQHRFDVQQNIAFFPAFPMTMRAVGHAAGAFERGVPHDARIARALWGGVLISIGAFAWAAWYLTAIARDDLGDERAFAAVLLLAAYPFAVFFSAPYTESLFLVASIGAWYHFRRHERIRASGWGLLAGLTRPNGFFLSVPLGLIALSPLLRRRATRDAGRGTRDAGRGTRDQGPGTRDLLVSATPAIGMLIYSAYIKHLTGAWFGWVRLHAAWGRTYSTPVTRAFSWPPGDGLLAAAGTSPFDALNALGLIFAVALLWPVLRRVGIPWAVFVLLNIVPPFLSGGLLSLGRLTSTQFPLFLALAAVLPPRAVGPWLVAFAIFQGLIAALFFTWRPMF